MKLSEAIRIGATLRPETHLERFFYIHGKGLCSDAIGAACEAINPKVAQWNWNAVELWALEIEMRRLRELQQRYFRKYYETPAVCAARNTSECPQVKTLIGLADHLFYAHRWGRLEVADAVEAIEEMRDSRVIVPIMRHYAMN